MCENPVNSLFGKKVLHVATAGEDYYQQRWIVCSDGTVHWQGYQASNSYRTAGLCQDDYDFWWQDGTIPARVAYYGSKPGIPAGAISFSHTMQLDSKKTKFNSNGQKVIAAWSSGAGYAHCWFLTDGGNDGESKRRLYSTESYSAYCHYPQTSAGNQSTDDNQIYENYWAWAWGQADNDGNATATRYGTLWSQERQENIQASPPVCMWPQEYYTNTNVRAYMIDEDGMVWRTGYVGNSYSPDKFYGRNGGGGGGFTGVYNWQRASNLNHPMKIAHHLDNFATTWDYAVVVGVDYMGQLWGGHASNTVPNTWISPVGFNNDGSGNTQSNNGETSWTVCQKY